MDENSKISYEKTEKGILNISLHGILDSATLNEIWSRVYEIIKSESPKEIILDASNLKHCDTIGGSFFF